MHTSRVSLLLMVFIGLLLTGCEVIGDIFGAGVYTGIFLVVVVIAVIIFAVFKLGRRK